MDFPALLDEALYAPDPITRDAARVKLAREMGPRELPSLLDLLDARNKLTRRRVARLFSDLDPKLSHPALAEALADAQRPARVRVAVARVLTATSDADAPALADGLSADDPRVRRACATPAAPVAALVGALGDPDVDVATRAAQALEARGATPPPEAIAAAVRQHGAVQALARLLARTNPQAPELIAAAQAGDPVALDHLTDPHTLRSLLHGPHCTAAAWGLTRGGALDPELATHPHPGVRAAIARALPPEHPALSALATDPDPGVAWLAQQAQSGAYAPPRLSARTAPHHRLSAPSAQAPYGLREDDPITEIQRPPAALALFQTSFDVNLGVAVRSAEAAGLREVFLVGRGALFRSPARGTDLVIPVHPVADAAALVRLARERGYQIVGVQQTPDSVPYHQAHYPPRPLFVMGAEGEGLPHALRTAADLCVEIPLFGVIDSLNVAAAATTVLFNWRVHRG